MIIHILIIIKHLNSNGSEQKVKVRCLSHCVQSIIHRIEHLLGCHLFQEAEGIDCVRKTGIE